MPRTDLDRRRYDENEIAYLERSARPEMALVRHAFEDWFRHYPMEVVSGSEATSLRDKLRGEVWSRNAYQARSAMWELYLHEVLRRAGYVVQVRRDTPDFLVISHDPALPSFHLEAATRRPPEVTQKERKAQALLVRLLDRAALDRGVSIAVSVSSVGDDPSVRAAARQALAWCVERTPASLGAGGQEEAFEDDATRVVVRAVPRGRPRQERCGGVGVFGAALEQVTGADGIREVARDKVAKAKKATRDHPLVLAIQLDDRYGQADLFEDALFGSEQIGLRLDPAGEYPAAESHRRGGFWCPTGDADRRVSAVLGARADMFALLSTGRAGSDAATLPAVWTNPWLRPTPSPFPIAAGLPWAQHWCDRSGQRQTAAAAHSHRDYFGLAGRTPT